MFNCAKIDDSKELVYLLFISEIFIDSIGNATRKEKNLDKKVKIFNKGIMNGTLVQIPTCVHCLERIDSGVTGIKFEGLIKITEEDDETRWVNSKKLCPYLSTKNKMPMCETCECAEDIFICLVCGYPGCGRNQNGCTLAHWKSLKHT